MKDFNNFETENSTSQKLHQLRNVSFPGSWETGTGFSQPRVHTVMVG